jgi:hypothetical protein
MDNKMNVKRKAKGKVARMKNGVPFTDPRPIQNSGVANRGSLNL